MSWLIQVKTNALLDETRRDVLTRWSTLDARSHAIASSNRKLKFRLGKAIEVTRNGSHEKAQKVKSPFSAFCASFRFS